MLRRQLAYYLAGARLQSVMVTSCNKTDEAWGSTSCNKTDEARGSTSCKTDEARGSTSCNKTDEARDSTSCHLKEERQCLVRSIEALAQRVLHLQSKKQAEAKRRAEAEEYRAQLQQVLQQVSLALATVTDSALYLIRECKAFEQGVLQRLTVEVGVSLACQRTVLAKQAAAIQRANARLSSLSSAALRESVMQTVEDLDHSLQQHERALQADAPNAADNNVEGNEATAATESTSDISRRVMEAQNAAQEALRLLRQAAPVNSHVTLDE
ncbi:hypothetical protein FHG87_003046 [Trinorchestia longiramus]|nr:hypothetical protein FHG87_003046 [Trinorchestia longiramus]